MNKNAVSYHVIYIEYITAVKKVETEIIGNIAVSLAGQAVMQVVNVCRDKKK